MKKRLRLFLVIILIVMVILSKNISLHNNSNKTVSVILAKEAYNYLPEKAKELVKETYNETGELIRTEKNKEKELPYLNPDYVEYLKSDKKSEYGHIPEKYIVDHTYSDNSFNKKQGSSNPKASLTYYNLRDEGYITNIYNQGEEGLCWAFASTTALESHLAIKSNKSKMLTFSEKQVDYSTTKEENAVDIGINPFLKNDSDVLGEYLGEGGNMFRFINSTAIGTSPVKCLGNCSSGTDYNKNNSITDNKYWKYDYEYSEKLSPYEITNIENTEYSINEYLHFNPLTNNDQEEVDSLVSQIKNQIVTNGSLYVDVAAYTNLSIEYTPSGTEKALNTNGNNIIYYIPYGWNPNPGTNHAVSVIGWDDSYTHKICLNKTDFEITDANKNGSMYSCTKGTLYTINGAWIIQNSWGTEETFIYLPYNTMKSSYSSITDVSEVDYDNSYRATSNNTIFTKGNIGESLNKVKFFLIAYDTTVNVYYKSSEKTIYVRDDSNNSTPGTFLKSVHFDQPGLHTIDLSDKGIVLGENTKTFKLSFLGNYIDYDYYGSIHTTNVDVNEKYIDLTGITKNDETVLAKCNLNDNKCIDKPHTLSFNDNNLFVISGITRNLSSTDNLTFKILDSTDKNVTNSFHIFRNYSVSNNINTLISYNSENIPLGTYTIEVYYNNVKYDEIVWNLSKHSNILSGIGTEYNPYLIKTTSDLNEIRNQDTKSKYYLLNNDIDLYYDTTNSKGLFYNSSKGWKPITHFYGNFNGNNHVISGLNINRTTSDDNIEAGLFSTIYGTNNYIKNLILKNVNINGYDIAGSLAGSISLLDDIEISNISVIGGTTISSSRNGGIIGSIGVYYTVEDIVNCNFYNLYSNINVGSTSTLYSGGLIGSILGGLKRINVTLDNSISFSKVSGDGSTNLSSVGGIIGMARNTYGVNINNILSAGRYDYLSDIRFGDIIGYADYNGSMNINRVYYLNKIYGELSNNDSSTITNNTKTTLQNIININYTNNFGNPNYWTKPTIDGIKRFPMPNSLVNNFDFTRVDDFKIKTTETKNIYDLIVPNIENAKNIEFSYDSSYLTINSGGKITPKKVGETILHINSLYDGYKRDVKVTIKDKNTVTYNSNNPSSLTNTQNVSFNQSFNLEKNPFTYNGYRFRNWNTKADGTGTSYYDEQLISGGIDDDLVLYAIWDGIITEARAFIDIPESGQKPSFTIDTDGSGRYTVEVTNWYIYDGLFQNIDENYTFIEGNNYAVRLLFKRNDGYIFDSSTKFTLNGNDTTSYDGMIDRKYIFYNIRKPKVDINNVTIDNIPTKYYTGKEIKPKLNLTFGNKTLTENIEYTLSYSNNIDIGTGTITITGIGDYKGTKNITFKIAQGIILDKTTININIGAEYDLSARTKDNEEIIYTSLNPEIVTVASDGSIIGISKGTGTIKLTTVSGKLLTVKVVVEPIKSSNVTNEKISNKTYTGKEITPKPILKYNGVTLKLNTDYTLSYSNNKNPGKSTVKVAFKGNYTGTKNITFIIIPKSNKITKIVNSSKNALKVFYKESKGVTGYQISYRKKGTSTWKNVKSKTLSVKLKKLDKVKYEVRVRPYITIDNKDYYGKWSSTKTGKVKEKVEPIKSSSIKNEKIDNKTYTGSSIKPKPVLKYEGETLKLNTDYTLSYKNNKNPGKATVKVTFKGDYIGTKNITFIIVPKKTKISKITNSTTKEINISYQKSVGVTGYQLAYRKKGTSKWQYVSSKKTSIKIKKLEQTNYEIKVRPYITISNKDYYGNWSDTKTSTVK